MAKSCLYHESANHHEYSYEPGGDRCAIRVTSLQDRICLDYFGRIGVSSRAVNLDRKGGPVEVALQVAAAMLQR